MGGRITLQENFNGAVTFSLRKSVKVHKSTQAKRQNFNGAVTFSLRKFPCTVQGNPVCALLLQWGRNFFVTEINSWGNPRWVSKTLQWGRNFFVTEIIKNIRKRERPSLNFNGAVTFSLRKCFSAYFAFSSQTALQWGRNFFVTEIQILASMSLGAMTLQWGRNFFVTEIGW